MFKEKMTEEELNNARQNGFILTGKHGTGKTTLLNLLFDQKDSETKNIIFAFNKTPQVYYFKLKNGVCVS